MADPAQVRHRGGMATVVLVQLAIAVLGFCVLAIAAAPALTRPVRGLVRSDREPAFASMSAALRVMSRRLCDRRQELSSAGNAAAKSCRVTLARAAAALRRGGELAVVAVRLRLRTAWSAAHRARHARGAQTTAQGDTAPAHPDRVIDLRDKRSAGGAWYRARHRA